MTAALPLFDYDHARRLKAEGMASVSGHSPGFSEQAYQALVRVAKRQLVLFADDLVAELKGLQPNHCNAWGPIYQRAVRDGVIQRSREVRPSRVASKRCRLCPVYFSLIHDPRSP